MGELLAQSACCPSDIATGLPHFGSSQQGLKCGRSGSNGSSMQWCSFCPLLLEQRPKGVTPASATRAPSFACICGECIQNQRGQGGSHRHAKITSSSCWAPACSGGTCPKEKEDWAAVAGTRKYFFVGDLSTTHTTFFFFPGAHPPAAVDGVQDERFQGAPDTTCPECQEGLHQTDAGLKGLSDNSLNNGVPFPLAYEAVRGSHVPIPRVSPPP